MSPDALNDWRQERNDWIEGTLLDEADRRDYERDRDDLRDDKGE